ncbi:hypothetical protein AC579_5065 [Pseudocercospora musae]|uniref:Uncharacterized protein n=1 Tax=Pseudocercospora musae TaxID=113226 RepID=A0A139HDT1_9PEZI|nr:hypothetical protein AC579_5065 [Pseudocercospora musae]
MTYCYINAFGDTICEDSGWYKWGRWVVVGVVVALFVLAMIGFLVFSRISARQRVKAGQKPMWGTQWAAPPAYAVNDPHPDAPKRSTETDPDVELPQYGAPPR